MPRKPPYWILALLSVASILRADNSYYDQQEEIRRAAKRLDDYDREQREAAKIRYDKAHRPSDSNSGNLITFPLIVLAFVAYAYRHELFGKKPGKNPTIYSAPLELAPTAPRSPTPIDKAGDAKRAKLKQEIEKKIEDLIYNTSTRTGLTPEVVVERIGARHYHSISVKNGTLVSENLLYLDANLSDIEEFCRNLHQEG